MKIRIKSILLCAVFVLMIGILSAWFLLKGENGYSVSERRELAKFPKFNFDTVMNGSFTSEFEDYCRDRFPARDSFRSVKAVSEFFIFGNTTCNGFYLHNGHIGKTEYPMNTSSLDGAADKIKFLYDKFLAENVKNTYFSLIIDKNAFLAGDANVLSMDYAEYEKYITEKLSFAEYISIYDLLDSDDFYFTDQHWKQESIVDVADRIADAMGNPVSESFEKIKLDNPFYGTYYSQAALPHTPDEIYYLTNDMIESCTVTSLDTGTPEKAEMYNMKNAFGRDPYEMYLCGSQAIMRIDNPNADTDKKLVVFRDSFGSSIVPLMVESYSSITLVDTRYIINSAFLGNYIDFSEFDDALFLYSTLILNNSTSMK